jgi:predicted nicotinamide N-methyase
MHALETALMLQSPLHGRVGNRRKALGRVPLTSAFTPYETDDVLLDTGTMTVRLTKIKDLDSMLDDVDPITFAEDERLPYWAELWPSAIGLARYLDRDVSLHGKQVLELGCGLGLLGIVAARDGARMLCTDYEANALAFARHNALQNGCRHIRFRLVDWRYPALKRRYDVILASDVIYEARNFGPLVALLQRFLARGGCAFFADPGRPHAVPFFALLRQRGFTYHKVTEPVVWEGRHQIAIYVIRHRTDGRPTSNVDLLSQAREQLRERLTRMQHGRSRCLNSAP